MTVGMVGFLVLWGLTDLILWLVSLETMSQFIIRKRHNKYWRGFAVFFCALVSLIGLWLFFHWELV